MWIDYFLGDTFIYVTLPPDLEKQDIGSYGVSSYGRAMNQISGDMIGLILVNYKKGHSASVVMRIELPLLVFELLE
jgi:hypothetical protein